MDFFRSFFSFNIKQRIFGGMFFILTLVILNSYSTYRDAQILRDAFKETEALVFAVDAVSEFAGIMKDDQLVAMEIFAAEDREQLKGEWDLHVSNVNKVRRLGQKLLDLPVLNDIQRGQVREWLKEYNDDFLPVMEKIKSLVEDRVGGGLDEIAYTTRMEELERAVDQWSKRMLSRIARLEKKLWDILRDEQGEFRTTLHDHVSSVLIIGTFCAMAIVLIGVGLFAWVVRPITKLKGFLRDIAFGDGDLTRQLPLKAQRCSQIMECNEPTCPSYGKDALCWSESGSFFQCGLLSQDKKW